MNRLNVNNAFGSYRNHSSCCKLRTAITTALTATLLYILAGCAAKPPAETERAMQDSRNPDDLFVVDCMLPGQVRQLGQNFTFMAPRQAIKTTAFDCGLRGGEFVAYNRANYQTALNVWLPQAQQGNVEAQAYVGEIYEKGLGVAPNYPLAAEWYRKAAKQGSSRAQTNLGYLYEKGLGVEQDLPTALNYYRNASGLTDDDLTYASSVEIETQARVGAVQKKVDALQRELGKSRAETKTLQRKVTSYQSQVNREKKRLNSALDELGEANRKLKSLESAPAGQQNPQKLMEYRREVEELQSNVLRERSQIKDLERKYQSESSRLNTQLQTAERKVKNYETELKQNKQTTDSLATRLAESEAQLKDLKQTLVAKEKSPGVAANADLARELDSIKQKLAESESKLVAQNRQTNNLASQVAALSEEKRSMEAKLSQTGATDSSSLKTLAQQLTSATRELSVQNSLLAELQADKEKLVSDKARLQQSRDQDIGQKDEELRALKKEIEKEEKQNKILKEELAKAGPTQTASLAPPTIELIDPPLSTLRGALGFKLRSAVDFRDITGNAIAPAGIMALTVNDKVIESDPSGIFKSRIQLNRPENPVNVTLIDKSGAKADLNFIIISHSKDNSAPVSPPVPKKLNQLASGINFGPYHALLIGNENYTHLPKLDTPIDDVQEIDKILRNKYNFNTTMLLNADRYSVVSALNKLRSQLTDEDNLLIYYAGHGEVDQVNQRGQWLPVDAEQDNNANWISTSAITDIINSMSVKHILVVADSCYSGAMTRASVARLDAGMSGNMKRKWLEAMVVAKSRTVLSSGGVKPVLDSGADGHSIFARAFLNALKNNADILEAQSLYRTIHRRVKRAAEKVGFDQSPLYGPIRHTGHEAGDFFFVPKA